MTKMGSAKSDTPCKDRSPVFDRKTFDISMTLEMNLQMPEFCWRYGDLFVIGLSAATAIATLLYFKRN